jgi:hypothetical protein
LITVILASALMITVFAKRTPDTSAALQAPKQVDITAVASARKVCMGDATTDDAEILCVNRCLDMCGGDTAVDEDCLRMCDGGQTSLR